MGKCFEKHRREVVGQQLYLFMDMLSGHLVHEPEVRHRRVHELDGDIHPRLARIRLDTKLGRERKRLHAFPVRNRAERRPGCQQIVQMRGAGAGQTRNDDRRQQFDLMNLGMAGQQVGEQQPVLQQLQYLGMEAHGPGIVKAVDLTQCGEVDLEAFPVVVRSEVGQPGLGHGFGVQRVGIQRTLCRHCRHQVANLVDVGAEARHGQVVEMYGRGPGLRHG